MKTRGAKLIEHKGSRLASAQLVAELLGISLAEIASFEKRGVLNHVLDQAGDRLY